MLSRNDIANELGKTLQYFLFILRILKKIPSI